VCVCVCVCVCVFLWVTSVSLTTTTDEPIEMLFEMWTRGAEGTIYWMGPTEKALKKGVPGLACGQYSQLYS